MGEGKHSSGEQPTDSYRCDNYERHPEPVVRPTGEAGPDETVSHRSYDHDRLHDTIGTVRSRAETKPVKASDPSVGTK
ncbi:MAG TPA: hypothetical protein VJ851_00665 [Jatrophihabitans sp.]|nr:hypothetical protein [Jatrophihabitans sp.]